MSKHTPGPYKITRDYQSPCSIEAVNGDGAALAKVYLTDPKTRKRTDEFVANAHLFKAAPDMKAALRALLDWAREHTSPSDPNSPHDLLIAADAALKMAEG